MHTIWLYRFMMNAKWCSPHCRCKNSFSLLSVSPSKNGFVLMICLTLLVKNLSICDITCHIVLSTNLFPVLPCHLKLIYRVSRKFLSSTCSSAAIWIPAVMYLLFISHREEETNFIDCSWIFHCLLEIPACLILC